MGSLGPKREQKDTTLIILPVCLALVCVYGELTDSFEIITGVGQGCAPSSIILTMR